MQGRLFAVACALMLAGCFAADEEASPVEVGDVDDDPPRDGPLNTTAAAVAPLTIDVLLDGNTGTSAVLCAEPAGQCAFQEVAPGVSGALFEALRGTLLGGDIVLTWTAATPATTELSVGLMTMGAEACDGASLAIATGPSPLALVVPPMERALCEGEIVHLWVSGTTWGNEGGAYYQVDTDQAFHAEGALRLLAEA